MQILLKLQKYWEIILTKKMKQMTKMKELKKESFDKMPPAAVKNGISSPPKVIQIKNNAKRISPKLAFHKHHS